MRAYFDRLSIRARLALGFGAIIGLICFSDLLETISSERSMAAIERYFNTEDHVGELAADSMTAMEKARRYEREFLQRLHSDGYERARAESPSQVFDNLAVVRRNMASVRMVRGDLRTARVTRQVETYTLLFEHNFLRVVHMYGKQEQFGSASRALDVALSGMHEGAWTGASTAVPLRGRVQTELQAELKALRQQEHLFLSGHAPRAAAADEDALARLQALVEKSITVGSRKDAMLEAMRRYSDAFSDYVQVVLDIDAATGDYLAAARDIEPALRQLREESAAALASTRSTVRKATGALTVIIGTAWLLNLLLGMVIARYLIRSVQRSVDAGVQFARRLAAGDWQARMDTTTCSKEFAVLAESLNSMAFDLHQGHERDQQHQAELERVNRTLRVLFRCNESLVRTSSEPQLLDAICKHLADEGGYPLAWVGLPCNDDEFTIRPAALAGLGAGAGGGAAMLRFHWGAVPEQRGLAGEAIVREQIVLGRATGDVPGELGYASGVALPLAYRGDVLGVLVLYSLDADAFDTGELKLLSDLAGDLAFGLVGMRDALRRRLAEQALDYQARHDALTGLPNRALFNERLHQATIHAMRSSRHVAVLVAGLDRYREVKNHLGHDASNLLLKHVAQNMTGELRDGDTVARLLGDEFAVVVSGLTSNDDVMTVASKLMAAVQRPLLVNGVTVITTASVGIALHMRDGADAASLLCCANAAMVSAQAMGGNRMRYYAPEMNERASQLFALEADLKRGLEQNELRVYYQPRAIMATGEIVAAEALLRWNHPQRGMVPPGDFIELAESSGLIVPIGTWVLREVCRQQRVWLDEGWAPLVVAVNLSPRQFREEGLVQEITRALCDFALDPACIELEITESTVMDKLDQAIVKLHALRAIGIKLSLDDFGTGHSSLSRLRELPVDCLKIDQSFVRHLTDNPADAAICHSIIDLAHNLNLHVIAEGVETVEHADYLRAQHCDEMQGYYLARPLPAVEFHRMVERQALVA